jgi:hypothetical protein
VKGTILPPDNLNVLGIVSIATPPIKNPPALLNTKELFSKNPSVIQDATGARVLLALCIVMGMGMRNAMGWWVWVGWVWVGVTHFLPMHNPHPCHGSGVILPKYSLSNPFYGCKLSYQKFHLPKGCRWLYTGALYSKQDHVM